MYKYAVCYIGSGGQLRIRFTGNSAFLALLNFRNCGPHPNSSCIWMTGIMKA